MGQFEVTLTHGPALKAAGYRWVALDLGENHIDRDCFELLVADGVYLRYAQAFLKAEQIDEVEIGKYVRG